jgi:hypothetical protein
MDRIKELLGRITELGDDELTELRDLVLAELDTVAPEGDDTETPPEGVPFATLETLANAAVAIEAEEQRREKEKAEKADKFSSLKNFRNKSKETPVEESAPVEAELATETPEPVVETPAEVKPEAELQVEEPVTVEAPAVKESVVTADAGKETEVPQVPEDRKPQARETARTTVIRAGADLPGIAMGAEMNSREDLARAMVNRIQTMRGIRGGDGDKLIVASASLEGVSDAMRLSGSNAEANTAKVAARTSVNAIVAAGGLGAPEEVRYDLFDMVGDTTRPVRDALPVFVTERGGIRFMRPPTLNDVNGVVGIWTVEDDILAAGTTTEALATRKPSFRVEPGPEVVVDTQAITMIMTFGNLMTRAYPELVARHTDLAMVAHARVAEQQLLAQIGALSIDVKSPNQRVGAVREVLLILSRATASYRNRHRMGAIQPLRAIFPVWFREVLRSDIALQHPGDGIDVFEIADAKIDAWFRSRNVNVTWAMDGEAGQDYPALVDGANLHNYPSNVVWYLFAEGTFAFMDGGTLDLGLVRDSTLNAANDYQTFVETFENVVKFGHESLRFNSVLDPTGQGAADVTLSDQSYQS